MENKDAFTGKRALITGGLGFIGSNLANQLVARGAKVTILDLMNPLYGGNYFNIKDIKDQVTVKVGDIRDSKILEELVPDQDYLFSLAAQVSPVDSSKDPFEDLDVNCRGHLSILEACREKNPGIKVFFSSSRMVYGLPVSSPMTEEHPTSPASMYGIHKLTAEKYYLAYAKDHNIRTVIGRITNPYGVRQQIKHSKYSIPGWFMRLAMEGQTIKIFGDGNQIRDYIYIEDLVEAILGLMATDGSAGQIFNIGSGVATNFKDMVETIVSKVGSGEVEYVAWPEDYKKIETGDAAVDISKLSQVTGWAPKVSLEEGVSRMIDYYKEHKENYIA
jgi:UDP-glucose 4-epimerase